MAEKREMTAKEQEEFREACLKTPIVELENILRKERAAALDPFHQKRYEIAFSVAKERNIR